MDFKDLLQIARDLKAENCGIIKDCLEKVLALNDLQVQDVYLLVDNEVDIETSINGVYEGCYCVYENFQEYIDNQIINLYGELPSFIELDYLAMWWRTFRYDDNLYIDWQELNYHKDRDEYGTEEQKQKYKDYVEYNLQYSKVINFYY